MYCLPKLCPLLLCCVPLRVCGLPTTSSWKTWTCDELTPDLCNLRVEANEFAVNGIKVAYWLFKADADPIKANKQHRLPIIVLHGGPGMSHNYMLPLKQQACRGRTVIFYDQGGCGESKLPSNKTVSEDYPWLLDAQYYATQELPALIRHLELKEFHLLGSSWGTMLAQLFALNAKRQERNGLVSMVLSGPLSDAHAYVKAQWDETNGSLGNLPPFVQERIHELDRLQAFDSPEYKALNNVLSSFFVCRTSPAPDCLTKSYKATNEEIYVGMQGPSEIALGGNMQHFNVTGRLGELVDVPVLLTHGLYDTMRPALVKIMYDALPVVEALLLKKSGHMSMIDEPGTMNDAIADFYDRVEIAKSSRVNFVPLESHDMGDSLPFASLSSGMSEHHRWGAAFVWTAAVLVAGWMGGRWTAHHTKRALYQSLSE